MLQECGPRTNVTFDLMASLLELQEQRNALDQRLYATWLAEREDVRRRIAALAVEYQIAPATAAKDIEAAQRKAPPGPELLQAPRVELPLRSEGTAQYVAPKFRDAATGQAWSGRGLQPRWLRDALAAGKSLEDFRIGDAVSDAAPARDPLLQFREASERAMKARRRPRLAPGAARR